MTLDEFASLNILFPITVVIPHLCDWANPWKALDNSVKSFSCYFHHSSVFQYVNEITEEILWMININYDGS